MSPTLHLDEIAYTADSCALFECLRGRPGAALLDSSHPHGIGGRFDIMVAEPNRGLGLPQLEEGADVADYFDSLSVFHREYYAGIQAAAADIPFCGGLLGYIGYEPGNRLHGVTGPDTRRGTRAGLDQAAPSAQLLAYDWAVIQDHLRQRSVLVSLPWTGADTRRELLSCLRERPVNSGNRPDFQLLGPFAADMDASEYRSAFTRIKNYINAGDCYQVNLAQRFNTGYSGEPWVAYQRLRALAAAPYSAYISLPQGALLSLSPERFIALQGHHVETSPIKGTRPRHADPENDRLAATELCNSAKDRAENLMIVDLLRNDLGRSCIPGSIHVDRLFELHSFATVHHLISTISGELQADRSAFELLRDSFPGGSITGAPKRRAMEIIAELEPVSRQAYCGSLVYISADGRMDSNIAIRTLLCDGNGISCWGGGGIVADSQCEQEYQETHDKIGSFLALLETEFSSG